MHLLAKKQQLKPAANNFAPQIQIRWQFFGAAILLSSPTKSQLQILRANSLHFGRFNALNSQLKISYK